MRGNEGLEVGCGLGVAPESWKELPKFMLLNYIILRRTQKIRYAKKSLIFTLRIKLENKIIKLKNIFPFSIWDPLGNTKVYG